MLSPTVKPMEAPTPKAVEMPLLVPLLPVDEVHETIVDPLLVPVPAAMLAPLALAGLNPPVVAIAKTMTVPAPAAVPIPVLDAVAAVVPAPMPKAWPVPVDVAVAELSLASAPWP